MPCTFYRTLATCLILNCPKCCLTFPESLKIWLLLKPPASTSCQTFLFLRTASSLCLYSHPRCLCHSLGRRNKSKWNKRPARLCPQSRPRPRYQLSFQNPCYLRFQWRPNLLKHLPLLPDSLMNPVRTFLFTLTLRRVQLKTIH